MKKSPEFVKCRNCEKYKSDPTINPISVRQAARQRIPLSGTDAQCLEGALSQAERELSETLNILKDIELLLDKIKLLNHSKPRLGFTETLLGEIVEKAKQIQQNLPKYLRRIKC